MHKKDLLNGKYHGRINHLREKKNNQMGNTIRIQLS